ncbi:beta-lactamase [Klebsiella pneumoniae subsp. pneumoniae]|nr:beta-lactamase [Klebsiella pneumoniae subsp. pneumoniae]
MSLTLRLTGTGGAQLVPVFGCDCAACRRARREESHRRRPCSGVVTFNSAVTLLDAGRPDLMEHHPAGSFQQVLLTPLPSGSCAGLFPLRWGVGASIPVYGRRMTPAATICSNTPVCLTLAIPSPPFVMFNLQGLRVTPLPLNHSKLTFGYLLESAHSRLAWLSDTAGLPDKSLKFLLNNRPQAMIIDCSHEPRAQTPRNHNDLNTVRSLNQVIGCPRVILTHISHQFDVWMMDNPLPTGFEAGYDGMEIALD